MLNKTDSLPVITAPVLVYNQNYDRLIDPHAFQIKQEREVEVLQLNLSSGSMRVRFPDVYQGKRKVVTQYISIRHFFDSHQIIPK